MTTSINKYSMDYFIVDNRRIKMNKLKKILLTGLATLAIGLSSCRNQNHPRLIVSTDSDINPQQINYSETITKSYIDKKPFGTLDYLIIYKNGERIEKKPIDKDVEEFTRIVREAWNNGYLNQVARVLREKGELTRYYPIEAYE